MRNRAWDMLREQFKPDRKGRFKTLHAMSIAKQLANENEQLQKRLRILAGLISTMDGFRNQHPQQVLDWIMNLNIEDENEQDSIS